MASHFKWYPASPSDVVPWNARYSFPTQANKTTIVTPRIPPKNGGEFRPGNVIRVEFPAQGYVNPANTFLEFDLTMLLTDIPASGGLKLDETWLRMQNNISSIFSRVRLMYGSTPLEDIIDYNQIVRNLTEWTATSGQTHDQTSISEGIGGVMITDGYASVDDVKTVWRNVRQASIQGLEVYGQGAGFVPNDRMLTASSLYKFGSSRRYQIQFALGLFTQEKLIPTKYMASQLAIELTLATPAECMYNGGMYSSDASLLRRKCFKDSGIDCSYAVSNVSLIPEILEFDASYDASILKGLSTGGIPIKFSSWHTFQYSASGSQLNLQIQERSRSVKSIFACLKRSPASLVHDSGATLFMPVPDQTLQNFQYRIGGRYYPAAPVQTSLGYGSSVPNGGAEAFCELQKALNIVSDYRLSAGVNSARWGVPVIGSYIDGIELNRNLTYDGEAELDYDLGLTRYTSNGTLMTTAITKQDILSRGGLGSQCFAMAVCLEASNGMEVSGLNAEEQSDISLLANYSAALPAGYFVEVFTYYDAMLVIKENNTIELVL